MQRLMPPVTRRRVHIDPLVVPVCEERDAASIEIPHPFNYMILKLFAFDDRKEDDRVDRGRHHAFDLYGIVAMLTRQEWDRALALREEHREADVVQRAVEIVREHFADQDRVGRCDFWSMCEVATWTSSRIRSRSFWTT